MYQGMPAYSYFHIKSYTWKSLYHEELGLSKYIHVCMIILGKSSFIKKILHSNFYNNILCLHNFIFNHFFKIEENLEDMKYT